MPLDCDLCRGTGVILFEEIRPLADQMQRVANLMQGGHADRAAQEYRIAVRMARTLLRSEG